MKKNNISIVAIFIVAIFFCIGFSGCNDNKNVSTNDFIGTWTAIEEADNEQGQLLATAYYTWAFYENNSVYTETRFVNETLNETRSSWDQYQVTEDKLIRIVSEGDNVEFDYSFSADKKKLTLSQGNASLTFDKIE